MAKMSLTVRSCPVNRISVSDHLIPSIQLLSLHIGHRNSKRFPNEAGQRRSEQAVMRTMTKQMSGTMFQTTKTSRNDFVASTMYNAAAAAAVVSLILVCLYVVNLERSEFGTSSLLQMKLFCFLSSLSLSLFLSRSRLDMKPDAPGHSRIDSGSFAAIWLATVCHGSHDTASTLQCGLVLVTEFGSRDTSGLLAMPRHCKCWLSFKGGSHLCPLTVSARDSFLWCV